jgi:hypothetical protein
MPLPLLPPLPAALSPLPAALSAPRSRLPAVPRSMRRLLPSRRSSAGCRHDPDRRASGANPSSSRLSPARSRCRQRCLPFQLRLPRLRRSRRPSAGHLRSLRSPRSPRSPTTERASRTERARSCRCRYAKSPAGTQTVTRWERASSLRCAGALAPSPGGRLRARALQAVAAGRRRRPARPSGARVPARRQEPGGRGCPDRLWIRTWGRSLLGRTPSGRAASIASSARGGPVGAARRGGAQAMRNDRSTWP